MQINVLKTEYHRNGVGGVGFNTILFEADDEGESRRYMATVFPASHPDGTCETCDYFGECPDASNGLTAVLDTDSMIAWASLTDASYISNWRGDHFERPLRQWLWDNQKTKQLADGFDSIKHFEDWKEERALASDMKYSDLWLSKNPK